MVNPLEKTQNFRSISCFKVFALQPQIPIVALSLGVYGRLQDLVRAGHHFAGSLDP